MLIARSSMDRKKLLFPQRILQNLIISHYVLKISPKLAYNSFRTALISCLIAIIWYSKL